MDTITADNDYQRKLDEFRELGLEYRYKDQMMVQELGFTLTAQGLVASSLIGKDLNWGHVCLQVVLGIFAVILYRHLNHTNQDRRAALERKENLRKALSFEPTHLGVNDKRLSAPRTMVWFARGLIPVWWLWVAFTIFNLVWPRCYCGLEW